MTRSSGVAFRHHAAHSDAWLYPETFGAGAALFDLDVDRDLDLLLLDTGAPPGSPLAVRPEHALYRNVGGLRFERTGAPDLAGLSAMGACTGDVDRDGDADLYVTGLPAGRLLLQRDGALTPAPGNGGIEDPGWGTSCAFLDHDGDGDLDLFVAHYVKWSAAEERACGGEVAGFRSYCPPSRYAGEADRLFAGDGKGRFADVSARAGLSSGSGKGLGVVAADFDRDGDVDVFVANDQVPNDLLLDEGATFREAALPAGVAFSEEGKARAGMGVDAGDVDGDGALDLTVTHLDLEASALFLALSPRPPVPRFRDVAPQVGLAAATLMKVGWGTALADLDSDGDLDLFAVNGHVLPNVAVVRKGQEWAMEAQLFEQAPRAGAPVPRLFDARAKWLPAAATKASGRGLAAGDLDGDGDLDLVLTANDGPARVLRNDRDPKGRFLGLALVATTSAPGAPGAWAELADGGRTHVAVRRTGGSYLSASDERVLFGLASSGRCEPRTVVVHWPERPAESFGPLEEGRYHVVVQGTGQPVPAR